MSGPSSIVHCAKMRPSMKSWQSWAPVCKRFNATSQRNGWREVRSRARSSIGGKQTTFGTPTRSTYADRASLKLTPAELAPLSHDIPRKCAPAKDLRSIYSRRSQLGWNPRNYLGKSHLCRRGSHENVRKRTEETVFLSIWCQRMAQGVSPVKAATRPRVGAAST